jgi:hypothetical protein
LDLVGAKIAGNLEMSGSSFAKTVKAEHLSVGASLYLRDATFDGDLDLVGSKIAGNLEMSRSKFAKTVNAGHLSVDGSLLMREHATFSDEVKLLSAKIAGNLEMSGSSFAKTVKAEHLSVGASLLLRDATFAGDLDLVGAKVAGNLEMSRSKFAKTVRAIRLSGEGDLLMRDATFNGDLELVGSKISSNLEMSGSSFAKTTNAERLSVGGNLFMGNDSKFRSEVILIEAKVGALLDLQAATAVRIDLTGADVAELRIAGLRWWCAGGSVPAGAVAGASGTGDALSVQWPLGDRGWQKFRCATADDSMPPMMIMRNAHVGALQHSRDAWPPSIDLEGFHYDRLWDIGQRSPEEWADWIARDTFSPQPYTQLSSVLIAAGRRDVTEAIQFAGRERERDEAWAQHDLGAWT